MSDTVSEILAPYAGQSRIPLRELGERLGMDRAARSYGVTNGIIRTAGRGGPGGGYVIDQTEARRLVVAALIAAAACVAVVTVLTVLGGVNSAGLSAEAIASTLP